MDRLIAANSVNFAGRDVAPLVGTKQYATSGNPGAGIPGTIWPAYQYNAIQEEILAVINAAGIAFDNTNNAQLLAALQGLGSYSMGSTMRCRIVGTPLLLQVITGTVVVAGASGAGLPAGLFFSALGALNWPVTFPNACIYAKGSGEVATNNYLFDMIGSKGVSAWSNAYAIFNQTTNNVPYAVVALGY